MVIPFWILDCEILIVPFCLCLHDFDFRTLCLVRCSAIENLKFKIQNGISWQFWKLKSCKHCYNPIAIANHIKMLSRVKFMAW
jgi:hypothetical protein